MVLLESDLRVESSSVQTEMYLVPRYSGRFSQTDVLNHIRRVGLPYDVLWKEETFDSWAERNVTPEPRGYVLMPVPPVVMNLPRTPNLKKAEKISRMLPQHSPPIVVDRNLRLKAVFEGTGAIQPHTVIDGVSRVDSAARMSRESILAYVPVSIEQVVREASLQYEVRMFAMKYFQKQGYSLEGQSEKGWMVLVHQNAKTTLFTPDDIKKVARENDHKWTWR